MGDYITGIPDLGEQFAAANTEVDWFDPTGHGYTIVTLTPERVSGEFVKVSTIVEADYTIDRVATFTAVPEDGGVSNLSKA